MRNGYLYIVIVLALAAIYCLLFNLTDAVNNSNAKEILGLLRGYTPTFAAVLTIALFGKKGRLKKFWKNILNIKFSPRALLVVFLIPVVINALVVLVTMFFWDGSMTVSGVNIPKFVALYFIFIFLDGPLGEELGWRGYFLPKLLQRFSPLLSSLIIGIVMFFWHMIIFSADGPNLNFEFISKYLVSILGVAMIFTFVFLRFSKAPLIAVLLHTSVNYFIFLRNSLIPEMKDTPIDNIAYVVIVFFAGVLSMIFLRARNSKEKVKINI